MSGLKLTFDLSMERKQKKHLPLRKPKWLKWCSSLAKKSYRTDLQC